MYVFIPYPSICSQIEQSELWNSICWYNISYQTPSACYIWKYLNSGIAYIRKSIIGIWRQHIWLLVLITQGNVLFRQLNINVVSGNTMQNNYEDAQLLLLHTLLFACKWDMNGCKSSPYLKASYFLYSVSLRWFFIACFVRKSWFNIRVNPIFLSAKVMLWYLNLLCRDDR